jgi:hypothetical protein
VVGSRASGWHQAGGAVLAAEDLWCFSAPARNRVSLLLVFLRDGDRCSRALCHIASPATSAPWSYARAGHAPVRKFTNEGRLIAKFFFAADPDGYQIELLERAKRFK